ncbi:MAG: NAD(P)/FAD-dependent oxidoreductase [Anaerolineales bacterium]|nr:NAD(P)/FAD-dependent oxidoreductase [Anaerolineales bacterium]
MPSNSFDAIIVGAGPNGLAAAIVLTQAGWRVQVREACATIGGGTRTAELTLPGFAHDVCSAIHPLSLASPFLRALPLEKFGLEFIHPPAALAHPLDDGTAILLEKSIGATSAHLGPDAGAYQRLLGFVTGEWEKIIAEFLGPLRLPKHPLAMAGFGLLAMQSATGLAQLAFKEKRAQALFAGLAAHSIQPLENSPTAAFGLMLGMLGHAVGWPLAKGGSHKITQAMAAYLQTLGGEVITNAPVQIIDELPPVRAVLLDVTPRQLLKLAAHRFPAGYVQSLKRYRYGPGVFKMDFALDGPIPWRAAECLQAGTVHVGGTLAEIAASERVMWHGEHSERPYVLVAQQSLFDETRTPAGKHTGWAYCHVPHGSTVDMSEVVIKQIERFAPGFQERILATHTLTAMQMQAYNANYVGGDINGGVQDFTQLFTRPAVRFPPYATPAQGIYLCSSSTPPGGGVHGMCGYWAAQTVLEQLGK